MGTVFICFPQRYMTAVESVALRHQSIWTQISCKYRISGTCRLTILCGCILLVLLQSVLGNFSIMRAQEKEKSFHAKHLPLWNLKIFLFPDSASLSPHRNCWHFFETSSISPVTNTELTSNYFSHCSQLIALYWDKCVSISNNISLSTRKKPLRYNYYYHNTSHNH